MNIFFLDNDPTLAAQMLCDKHLIKMILESAQLLCSAHESAPYKRTHYNHPCAKWTRNSKENYEWLVRYSFALCDEYEKHFHRKHKSKSVIQWAFDHIREIDFPSSGFSTPSLAMPEKYKTDDPVQAYRNYYIGEKSEIAKWSRGRVAPDWMINDRS